MYELRKGTRNEYKNQPVVVSLTNHNGVLCLIKAMIFLLTLRESIKGIEGKAKLG
jgi:hypothetical protein